MSTTNGKTVMVQGRIVWVSGDLFKGRIKTEFGTQRPKLNERGEQVIEYGFGLAVPKSALQQSGPGQAGEVWAAMHQEALSLYPSGQIPPSFAMKYKDGDGVDDQGVSFAQREGYAGHIVLACTTNIPIKFFRWENGQNIMVNEGIKCGDYVNVQLNVKAHGAIGQGKPGLYLNPYAVQFLGYGKEIINAPSGDQIFGTQAPPVPAGASQTPIAPAGMIVPQPQAMAPQPYPNVLPQHLQQQVPMPQQMPQSPAQMPTQQAYPAAPAQMPGFPPVPR